jgi:hypothetical protein
MSDILPLPTAGRHLSKQLERDLTNYKVIVENEGLRGERIVVILKNMSQRNLVPNSYEGYTVKVRRFGKRSWFGLFG